MRKPFKRSVNADRSTRSVQATWEHRREIWGEGRDGALLRSLSRVRAIAKALGSGWAFSKTEPNSHDCIVRDSARDQQRRGNERAAARSNPFRAFAENKPVGNALFKWDHYLEIYNRYFAKMLGKEINVLEVGVRGGGSLDMWVAVLGPACRVYGVDIDPQCIRYEAANRRILIGHQGDRAFWARAKVTMPPLDVVIDDGSHVPEHQIATFEELWPILRPGGVYLVEDVHGCFNPFLAYVLGLMVQMNGGTSSRPWEVVPTPMQRSGSSGKAPRTVRAAVRERNSLRSTSSARSSCSCAGPGGSWRRSAPRCSSKWRRATRRRWARCSRPPATACSTRPSRPRASRRSPGRSGRRSPCRRSARPLGSPAAGEGRRARGLPGRGDAGWTGRTGPPAPRCHGWRRPRGRGRAAGSSGAPGSVGRP